MFGEPKDRTADQALLMAKEWFDALSGFGEAVVARAVTTTLRLHIYNSWPALAVVVAFARDDTRGWMDALGALPPDRHYPREQEWTPEQEAWRRANPDAFKRAREKLARELPPSEPDDFANVTRETAPAKPDDGTPISPEYRALLIKQGILKAAVDAE